MNWDKKLENFLQKFENFLQKFEVGSQNSVENALEFSQKF